MALLPYRTAVAVWMAISVSLYLASIWILVSAQPWPFRSHYMLIYGLAWAFEPFALECWLGGQLSAIASFSYALCFAQMQQSKPVRAGLALGICFYKPTLLILILPLFVFGRRWKELLGVCISGLILASLCWLFVGWDVSVSYAQELMKFSQSTSSGDLDIRTWKYVDLNHSLQMMLAAQPQWQKPVFAALLFFPFAALAQMWRYYDPNDKKYRRLLWATTLTWIPVLNVYVGIYDSILVVQAVYLSALSLATTPNLPKPLTESGYAYLVTLIVIAAWLNPYLAAQSGIPIYSISLMALGTWQLGRIFGLYPDIIRVRRQSNKPM
jgi:hypothetical protein